MTAFQARGNKVARKKIRLVYNVYSLSGWLTEVNAGWPADFQQTAHCQLTRTDDAARLNLPLQDRATDEKAQADFLRACSIFSSIRPDAPGEPRSSERPGATSSTGFRDQGDFARCGADDPRIFHLADVALIVIAKAGSLSEHATAWEGRSGLILHQGDDHLVARFAA